MSENYDDERDCDEYDDHCGDCGHCDNCLDEKFQECGMMPDGGCMLAGTEHCDFDCGLWEDEAGLNL